MTDTTTTPVHADALRVAVEMGEAYAPSERLTAALTELVEALAEDQDDVAGFGPRTDPPLSFVFYSRPVHGAVVPTDQVSFNFAKLE